MKLVKREFPNPVLGTGRDDYIPSCKFSTSVIDEEIKVTDSTIDIPVTYTLRCNGITKLIQSGKAKVIVIVESVASCYQRIAPFSTDSNSMIIQVPKYDVVTSIVLTGHIIAAEPISQFTCEGELNPDYFTSATFEIRKGDILATEYKHTIYIDDSELEKPIQSICQIITDDQLDRPILPIFTAEKIEIHLNQEMAKIYKSISAAENGALARYTVATIVYPVIVEAVARIRNAYETDNDDEADYTWFRAIVKKAESIENGVNDWHDSSISPADIANRIIGNVSGDSLMKLQAFIERSLDNSPEDLSIGGID